MKDICDILEIQNSRDVASRIKDMGLDIAIDKIGVNKTLANRHGGTSDIVQEETIVSEMALTAILVNSRKPQAKEFWKWLSKDVIPSLARRGGYIMEEDREEYKEDPEKIKELVKKLEDERLATAKLQRAFDETREDKFRIGRNYRSFIVPYGRLNNLIEDMRNRNLSNFDINGTLEVIRREMNEAFDSLYSHDRL